MKCVEVCPFGALTIAGRWVTVEEVIEEVRKDKLFYRNSGGGATLSGGEPLQQPKFATELLKACKAEGFHTALDTSGYSRWEVFEEMLRWVDLLLYDVKHMDSQVHRELTGVGNELILENLQKAAERVRTWIRVPLIPGCNDSIENIRKMAELSASLKVAKVSILPYHEWGKMKYSNLGRIYPLNENRGMPLTEEQIQEATDIVKSYGLEVTVGH
jgi:pyruvate formate lyase activating enzyme